MAAAALLVPVTGDLWLVPAGGQKVFEDSFLARLTADPNARYEALVTLDHPATAADARAIESIGVDVGRVYDAFGVIYVEATGVDLLRLGSLPDVEHVTGNEELTYFMTTATVATRARDVWDTKSTSTPISVSGSPLTGAGVGVAVVDSGVFGLHPDLAPGMGGNKKFVCSTPGLISTSSKTCFGNFAAAGDNGCANTFWVDTPDSDTTSGHGTHVAGIVAGRGVASDGRIMGAAPGATLYGLGTGEGLSILFALEAFNWIHCNHAVVAPNIRVVTNSWGTKAAFSASNPIVVATDTLVADGLVVLFAAGNDGGTGTVNNVNLYAKNPTAGVISVANYDDSERATRSGNLSASSSRGCTCDSSVSNWPDVSAPGTFITSTGDRTSVLGALPDLQYEPYYTPMSGTSMATPHVAGIAALLLQAAPALTPAAVEDILEDTAVQFATPGGYATSDPSNPTNSINHGSGHGLVNAIASLADSRVGVTGGSTLPQLSQSPHVYTAGQVDGQLASGVQWTEPAGVAHILSERGLTSGGTAISGNAFRFVVSGPGGSSAIVPATVSADSAAYRAQASFSFPSAGSYVVESQVTIGGLFTAWDSFVVRAV